MQKMILGLLITLASSGAYANSAICEDTEQFLPAFYGPLDTETIPQDQMQKFPYYRYVSMNFDRFAGFGTAPIEAKQPRTLEPGVGFDLNGEFEDGQSYLDNLIQTLTKGFVVLRNGKIAAEFYDNGFNIGMTNNLQSASKTYIGVLIHQLVDAGKIELDQKSSHYLPELAGSPIGEGTIQQLLDMTSGIEPLVDYHTPGTNGYLWEIEIGLQTAGEPVGHLNAIKAAKGNARPGTAWQYTDQNTDALGLIAEKVSGKKVNQLITELHASTGANYPASIAKTSDGTTSPSYGINLSARDYALFHLYIGQGKAADSFYKSIADKDKDLMGPEPLAQAFLAFGHKTIYGSQTYYMVDDDIAFSFGSFGILGFSDLTNGNVVINLQDWYCNIDMPHLRDAVVRSAKILKAMRK
jgi:CubicO group peptidase (beta-lactamase class C family)